MKEIIKIKYNDNKKKNNSKRFLTDNEYRKRLEDKTNGNIVPLEEYKGVEIPINHYCKKHNIEWIVSPGNILYKNNIGCPQCGKERYSKSRSKTTQEFINEVNNISNEYVVLEEYVNCKSPILIGHITDNKIIHTFKIKPTDFLNRPHCPYCYGRKICIGFNDFNTLYPNLSKYLNNYEDGYNIGKCSDKMIELRCPDCDHVFKYKACSLIYYGFTCPKCGRRISYPNKFIYNSLIQIKEDLLVLEREYAPKWCKFTLNNKNKYGKYDIYFELKNNKKYIIEMDGNIGHGDTTSEWSREDSLVIDNIKDELAEKHGIKVIRIDCKYHYYHDNKFEYVKNNILNSELKDILNLSNIDFEKSNLESLNSYLLKACELWNKGFKIKEIVSNLKLCKNTITDYLKKGANYNLCDYDIKKAYERSCCKEVYCITTNKLFNSSVEAAKEYGTTKQAIHEACSGKKKSVGKKNKLGIRLFFMYYDDYLRSTQEDVDKIINVEFKNERKVICLNNKEIFNKISDAKTWCGNTTTSNISRCCNGKRNTAGKHPVTGEKLKWMYYEEYLKLNNENN